MLLHDAKSKLCYNSALSGFQEGVKSGTARVGLLDFSLRFSFFFARLFVFDFSNVSHISHKPN